MSEQPWVLKMLPEASWDLASAVVLARSLQPIAHEAGFNLTLGGGVLNVGYSDKDLDLVLLPARKTCIETVIQHLSVRFWSQTSSRTVDSNPKRTVYKFTERSTGRRLDLIVVLEGSQ